METLLQDVRYAGRALARTPGFTAVALLTLAIGTGANATVFSFVNALLMRPAAAVRYPSSLIAVYTSDFSSGPYGTSSYPDYISMNTEASSFDGLAAYTESAGILRDGDSTERVRLMSVSGEFFPLLHLEAAVGRLLDASDLEPGAPPAAVISHDLWRRTYGTSNAVLGRPIAVDGQPYTIVGVAPPKFDGLTLGGIFDLWTPLAGRAADPAERGRRGLSVIGRLRDGVTLEAAQAELDGIAASLARMHPETNMGTLQHPNQPRPMVVLKHTRLHPSFRGMVGMLGATLMAAVALVLLVACANIANLLLSRTVARRQEIDIRLALGASRLRLVRQFATESLLLGVIGGAFGILFALWTADVMPSFFPVEQQRLIGARVDGQVIAFTVALSLVAGLLFGLVPAIQALRPGAPAGWRGDAGRISDARTGVVRAALVLSQVAVTFVLLVSAGLLAQSLSNATNADLGFSARDAVLANVEIPAAEITAEQGDVLYREALDRIRALPGIEAATLVRTPPLSRGSRRGFTMEGYQPRPGEDTELNMNVVEPEYFATMGIPVIDGRTFDSRDTNQSIPVVVVNDLLARRYFSGRAVGRRLRDSRGTDLLIVGVVRTGPYLSVQEAPVPVVYFPVSQSYMPRLTLVARTAGSPAEHAAAVRRSVESVHRGIAVFRVVTLEAHLAEALTAERLTAALVSASGTMALLLAVVGVYGVIAYGVARRRREICVRVALGARPWDVTRLVVSEGLRVTLIGIGGGILAALGATRLLASMLYGVRPWDASTFVAAALLLSAVAILAAWAPAHRAVRLDPVAALREE